jgi:hypothetical protein
MRALLEKGKPAARRGRKAMGLSCEKKDGQAAGRGSADTNLKSLIAQVNPKLLKGRTLRGVEHT